LKKSVKKLIVSVLAVSVLVSNISMDAFAASKKGKVEDSGNGYYIVTQKGGETLTYSKNSGIILLKKDGYIFKDLNKNKKLDKYEDWRLDSKTRAQNLADLMVKDGRKGIKSIAGLMLYSSHTAINSDNFAESTAEGTTQDGSTTLNAVKNNKIRHVLVTTIKDADTAAKWNNSLQAYCESVDYGIPSNNSSDPRHEAKNLSAVQYTVGNAGAISLWPSSLGMAATFSPELVKKFGKIAAAEYRAFGISTALSPQIDLATEPRWSRVSGTFGENSKMSANMAQAYIDGFQTTKGSKTGWGNKSVNCMVKHWPSGGPEEGGRDAHYGFGKYAVYPGDNFQEHLVPFTQGAFNLEDGTTKAAAVMPYYTISNGIDKKNDENVGNGFSDYIINDLLREKYNYDGVVCTDWMITADADNDGVFQGKCWGVENLTVVERHYKALMAGIDQFGGNNIIGPVMGAYDMMVKKQGKTFADKRFSDSARRLLINIFNTGLFENSYLAPDNSAKLVGNSNYMKAGYEAQIKSAVMLKNKYNIIKKYDKNAEKLMVYVPEYTTISTDYFSGKTTKSTAKTVSVDALSKYCNITDDPSKADIAIVGMSSPSSGSGYSLKDKEEGGNGYFPISLQYRKYTATTARKNAVASDSGAEFIDSETGKIVYTDTVDNRSYLGKSVTATNENMLDMLEATKKSMGNKPVIVYMKESNPMVWSEVEPLADAIVVGFGIQDQAAVDVIMGVYEPSGLLPMQQPASMNTVELQNEDVGQDMDCYIDKTGNTYDFGFGLNWSGRIADERTIKYCNATSK